MAQYKRYKDTPVMTGNSKLGDIPNVSLTPIETCINHKHCASDCYAVKFMKMYSSVRNRWAINTELARDTPDVFFNGIRKALNGLKPEFFRIHVSGDFFSDAYFNAWIKIVREYPDVKFLAFTKVYKYATWEIPENLSLVLSVFPDSKLPEKYQSATIAYAGEPEQYRDKDRAQDAVHCPGNCSTCAVCWSLAKKSLDVRFSIH